MRTNAIWDIDAKGALTTTSNATDIAITGRGFLPVTTLASVGQATTARPAVHADHDRLVHCRRRRLPAHALGAGAARLAGGRNGAIAAAAARQRRRACEPVQINRSSVAAQPTSKIDAQRQPAGDRDPGRRQPATALPVTVEYFDNLGASQTLAVSFTPTVPAVGDPQTNTWTLTITDQASGLSAGSYELVFSDAPPNAGAPISVTQTVAGAAPLATAYDAATGDIALDLGNQTITIGIGSTDRRRRST